MTELAAAAVDGSVVSDAVRIDRVAGLEKVQAATAAVQMAESVRFAQSQVIEQMAADVHPERIGQGIAEQLGLARRVSPVAGARRLGVARALWFDLPETYAALLAGELREQVAELVVSETRHLDPPTRRRVDAQVIAARITTMGYGQAAACARKYAYEADRKGYVERGRTERKHRRVGIRPAPDTMSILTGYLPVEQGAACYAALRQHTDGVVAQGDERTRDQIMADTLVERLTGQAEAGDVNIEVQITMPLDALLDPDDAADLDDAAAREDMAPEDTSDADPAETGGPVHSETCRRETGRWGSANLAGYGPLPVDLARELIISSNGRKWWRRLFTGQTGHLIGGDPTRRRFDGWLAKLISLRDQTCRDPYCDAPIRHHDHIHRWSEGGLTTLRNGRGTCARGNLIRELPGWQVTLIHSGQLAEPHTVRVTTPTGHTYLSRAPDPP